jgi:hypothetical protein
MIKKFDAFVNESKENKGKGIGGDTDLFPSAPKKQVINRSIPTMDFLRIGKHIQTKKIDGFIDSIQNESIFIADRMTGEIKKYSLREVMRELTKVKEEKPITTVQGFEGTPVWATKQKIYESDEFDETTIGGDVYGSKEEDPIDAFSPDDDEDKDPDYIDIELGDDEEDDDDDDTINTDEGTTDFGTEDNPEGTNDGTKREMPNESWIKYWKSFNQKQIKLVTEDLEEELDEEEEAPIIRGTEDNPLPDKKRAIIESYE